MPHHVVGVLGLDERREDVDPVLDGADVPAALARLVQQVPREDGRVLLVQFAVVCVAPACGFSVECEGDCHDRMCSVLATEP